MWLSIFREPASPSSVPDYLTQILREGKEELEKSACIILKVSWDSFQSNFFEN